MKNVHLLLPALVIAIALLSVPGCEAHAQNRTGLTERTAEVSPFVGWMKVGNGAVEEDAVVLGAELSIVRGIIRWTPLELITPIPGSGAYVKVSTGVGLVMKRGSYVGLLVGSSRFDSANLYIAARVGAALPLPLTPVVEMRLERYRDTAKVGSTESVSIRIPLRLK